MRGARKMMWKQFGLLIGGLILGLMLCTVCGCNEQDDAAKMAAMLAQQNTGGAQPTPKPAQQQQQQTSPTPGTNPFSEAAPEGDQEYSGPKVNVTDFSVKLPYEGFEGARRFDILCKVQSDEPVNSKAIWKIFALDKQGEVVGSQDQHLAIPHDYAKPLDINSFYCTAVPASLEFHLTKKLAQSVSDEDRAGSNSSGAPSRGIR